MPATTVQFSGTTVEKVGAAVSLRFIIAVAGGYSNKESGITPNLVVANPQILERFNTENEAQKIDTSSWKSLLTSLDIKLSGSIIESKSVHMAPTERTNKSIVLTIGHKEKLDTLADFLAKEKTDISISLTGTTGQTTMFKSTGAASGDATFHIGLEVASYSPSIGANGNIRSGEDKKWMGSPATGFAVYSTKGFSKKAKVKICMDFEQCKSSEKGLTALGVSPTTGSGPYTTKEYFKLTGSLEKQLDGKFFMYSHTDKDLKVKGVGFCAAMISEFCAELVEVTEVEDGDEGLKQLSKGVNVNNIGDADIQCGDKSSPCVISSKFKQPIYDLLCKHMTASGFTTILPDSYRPVSVVRNIDSGGNNYQYEFFGYEITGVHTKVSTIASESVKLWEFGGDVGNGKIRMLPIVPNSLKRDKITGAYSHKTATNLAFATNLEDLKKLNEDFTEEKYLFNAEVYANVVKETTYQMAEKWHQTAQLTLNDPRDSKNKNLSSRVIIDKLYDNGGAEHTAYLQGTKLELKEILFNSFSTLVANAGIKLGTKKVRFSADIVAREITEDADGNAESGKVITWTATSSVTIDDLMSFISRDEGENGLSESEFKDRLQVSLPAIKDGKYDIDDITFSYDFTWWNNWKFKLDVDKDVKSWEDVGLQGTWVIDEGRELTLSKRKDGNTYGLDMSWMIDSKDPQTFGQEGLKRNIGLLDGAVVKTGIIYNGDNQENPAEFSFEMTKKLGEGLNASMSLTDASITKSWNEEYKYGRHSQMDVGYTAGFGKALTIFDRFKKLGGANKVKEYEADGLGKGDALGGKPKFDDMFYDANANLDIHSTLFKVANNLGSIVFDLNTRTSLTQVSGVIQGISLTSIIQWRLTWKNQVLSTVLGLPANIHPHLGGAVGFTMQDVESSYWGTEYSGYKMTIGTGLYGITIVEHSRKDVIENIIERKRYGKLQFPIIGGVLETLDFFGWITEEESDEDYIARAWPCLVYNVINWQRQNYEEKLQEDMETLKEKVNLSGCEILKSTPGVGKTFRDFYEQEYQIGYPYLGDVADVFYNGGSHYHLQRYGIEPGTYKQSTIMGPSSTGAAAGEPSDRWYHWVQIGTRGTGLGNRLTIRNPVYFPEKPGLKPTGEIRPSITPPQGASNGDWINQNGVVLSQSLVDQVRSFNSFWACPINIGETKCSNPLDGFPNMIADGGDHGYIYHGGNTAFLNSACFAFMYMMREIKEFGAPTNYCGSGKKVSKCEPCKQLIVKWKMNEIATNQTKAIKLGIRASLLEKKELLTDELDGLTKERSISNSLFEAFSTLEFKGEKHARDGGNKEVKGWKFDVVKFLKGGKSYPARDTLWREAANDTVRGWMPRGPNDEAWLDSYHEVEGFDGAVRNMKMLTAKAAAAAVKRGEKHGTKNDTDEDSALLLMHTDPVWGLVKCYFTYMAPIGAEEEYVEETWTEMEGDPAVLVTKKKIVLNPLFDLPYDPNTVEAVAKQKEIRKRASFVSSALPAFTERQEGGLVNFGGDVKWLDGGGIGYMETKDEFGNLKVEVHADYRPGWVYRARNADGTVGQIVWVVPSVQAYKHEFRVTKVSMAGKVFDGLVKLASSGKGKAVTDVCGSDSEGGKKGVWRRAAKWFQSLWSFLKRVFNGTSQQYYRKLPWLYTDSTNFSRQLTHVNGKGDSPYRLNSDKFEYFPKGTSESSLTLPHPVQIMAFHPQLYADNPCHIGQGENCLSYQEVPWKGNPNSCYLDFYEYMEYVQRDAVQYFFPEIVGSVTGEDIHRFCIKKESTLQLFGYYSSSIILENCKKCDTCTTRPSPDGFSIAWPETVGLRSMLGTHDEPNEDLDVILDESLMYIARRTWPDWQGSAFQNSVSPVYVYDGSSTTDTKMLEKTVHSFDSLKDKYAWVLKRINYLNLFVKEAGEIFSDSSVTMPYPAKKVFHYPRYGAPNGKIFTYEKGESISSIGEQSALIGILADNTSSGKSAEYNPNLKSMQSDFDLIASEPKHMNRAGVHKYTDFRISNNSSSIGAIAGQSCIGKGKGVGGKNVGGKYCTTSSICKDVNRLLELTKPTATEFINVSYASTSAYEDRNSGFNGNPREIAQSVVRKPTMADWDLYKDSIGGPGTPVATKDALAFMGYPYYCFPDLTPNYMASSLQVFKEFVPLHSDLMWLFDAANKDAMTQAEKKNKSLLYGFILNDMDAAYHMFIVKMNSWRLLALDVLYAYWRGKISYTDLIWHLNKRLFPLIYTMNSISPIFIPKSKTDAMLGSQDQSLLDSIRHIIKGGWSNNAHDTHCQRQGISWSYFRSGRKQRTKYGQFTQVLPKIATPYRQLGIGFNSVDDLVYMHRNNVLALLFGVRDVEAFIAGGGGGTQAETQDYILSGSTHPSYSLFRMQVAADESAYAVALFGNKNSSIGLDPHKYNSPLASGLINSLTRSFHDGSPADGVGVLRPFGRDRYGCGSTSLFFPNVATGITYKSKYGNDLAFEDIEFSSEKINLTGHELVDAAGGARQKLGSWIIFDEAKGQLGLPMAPVQNIYGSGPDRNFDGAGMDQQHYMHYEFGSAYTETQWGRPAPEGRFYRLGDRQAIAVPSRASHEGNVWAPSQPFVSTGTKVSGKSAARISRTTGREI